MKIEFDDAEVRQMIANQAKTVVPCPPNKYIDVEIDIGYGCIRKVIVSYVDPVKESQDD